MRKYEPFDTLQAAVGYLVRQGYRQGDDGEWRRDSWHAVLTRLKNGTYRVHTI